MLSLSYHCTRNLNLNDQQQIESMENINELEWEDFTIVNSNDDIDTNIGKLEALYEIGRNGDHYRAVHFETSFLYTTILILFITIVTLWSRERAAQARERARDALLNGTFFCTIDEVWKFYFKSFALHKSFVRNRNYRVKYDKRYENTVKQANEKRNNPADDSARSTASDGGNYDIFRQKQSGAHSAHLMPHSRDCSERWFPIVPLVLHTEWDLSSLKQGRGNKCTVKWEFMQKCIHGSKSQKYKVPNVGIKHFPTNRIRLLCQADFLDRSPCVIIVPILTVEQVRKWDGDAYKAIVLAGDWNGYDRSAQKRFDIKATEVYVGINASGGMTECGNFKDFLAEKSDLEKARYLLEQMILCVCKTFNNSPFAKTKPSKLDKQKFDLWKRAIDQISEGEAPVPISNGWNVNMKIRKVSFSNSSEDINPAPDPALLLAKAASNWLKRNQIEILPGCDDDGSTTSDESSYFDDSADSVTSFNEDANIQGLSSFLATEEKPCVEEVNIDVNRDNVDEPLSDNESL
jgi:hypothetical protein